MKKNCTKPLTYQDEKNCSRDENKTDSIVNIEAELTPGQQSLKRLKEMPYTKPDGKAFVMGWRKR